MLVFLFCNAGVCSNKRERLHLNSEGSLQVVSEPLQRSKNSFSKLKKSRSKKVLLSSKLKISNHVKIKINTLFHLMD